MGNMVNIYSIRSVTANGYRLRSIDTASPLRHIFLQRSSAINHPHPNTDIETVRASGNGHTTVVLGVLIRAL